MVMLTDLADVARTSGLVVVEHPGWKTRAYLGRGLRSAKGTLCHWTGAATSASNPTAGLSVVRDGRAGVPGPLSQIFLAWDGAVHVLAAGWCNHAGLGSGAGLAGNPDCIGIECGGAGAWSPAQLDAYPRLVAALQRGYAQEPRRALSHQEWAPNRKVDIHTWPGGMAAFRATVAHHVANPTSEDELMTDAQFNQLRADVGHVRDQLLQAVADLPTAVLFAPIATPTGGETNLYSATAWSDQHIVDTRQLIRDAAASVAEQVRTADTGEAAAAAVVAAIDHRLAGLSITLTTPTPTTTGA